MTIQLTYEEARELLERAVDERGEDFVYAKTEGSELCEYFHQDGTPGCIVGQVLAYRGVTLSEIGGLNISGVYSLVERGFIAADGETQRLLETAQTQQDSGASWGDALASALAQAERESFVRV